MSWLPEFKLGLWNTWLLMLVIVLHPFILLAVDRAAGTAPFYAGLALWLAGLAIFLGAAFSAAVTPMGQVFEHGIYRFSRHPFYLSMLVMVLGALLAAAAWILLPLLAAFIILMNMQEASEERACLAAFGESYRAYMSRTPRWIGLPH